MRAPGTMISARRSLRLESSRRCSGVIATNRSTTRSRRWRDNRYPCILIGGRTSSLAARAPIAIAVPLVATRAGISPGLIRRCTLSTAGSSEPWMKDCRNERRCGGIGSSLTKSRCNLTAPTRVLVRALASRPSARISSVDPPPMSSRRWGRSPKDIPERTPR